MIVEIRSPMLITVQGNIGSLKMKATTEITGINIIILCIVSWLICCLLSFGMVKEQMFPILSVKTNITLLSKSSDMIFDFDTFFKSVS